MLYLVQHGEALPKDVDPERPLSQTGRDDIERLAAFLARSRVAVARVADSGKARAQQTAAILGTAVGGEPAALDYIGPNDSPDRLIDELARETNDLMVVGHLPYLGKLVARLISGRDEPNVVSFVPGTLACLERHDSDRWCLIALIKPEYLDR